MDTDFLHALITRNLGQLATLAAAIQECRDRETIDGLANLAAEIAEETAYKLHEAAEEILR
ncbi:hypothetical protein R0137_10995 [Congregibacter brevis]|uniref:Uncharacterized protein n=1 Tax=Congregibacter brevis TaxID=3081201 RepID=A0ABZ0IAM3_9GAMM|nr:hypothetical protein R0137_10995 [Congregibacter sp. IMCC45268]